MTDIKAGDKVRILTSDFFPCTIGEVISVTKNFIVIDFNGAYGQYRFDNNTIELVESSESTE